MARKRSNGDGTWWYDANRKRWIGQLAELHGKRPKTSAETEKDVRANLRRMASERQRGVDHTKPDVLVSVFLTEWLEDVKRASIDQSTYELYESKIRLQVNPHIGKIKIRALTPQQCQAMFKALLKTHANTTVHVTRTMLVNAFDTAVQWGLIPDNTVKRGCVLPPIGKSKVKPLDIEQIQTFLEVIAEHRLNMLFITALWLGLRKGELIALKWQDIDLQAGAIHIHDAKTESGDRALPLDTELITLFKAHKVAQYQERLAAKVWNEHGMVFPSDVGTPLHHEALHKTFKILLGKAGLPLATRFHDLRHTAISHMLANGARLKDVSEIAGHSDIRTTANIYGHAFEEGKRQAISSMGAVVKRKAQ